MTRDNALFLVAMIVFFVAWTVTFRLIRGELPKSRGTITWGTRWRSLVAGLVAAVLAAYLLEAAKSVLP
jgi:hypothetical protein